MKPPVVFALAAAITLASTPVGATTAARVVVTPQVGVPFESVDSGNGPVEVSGSASDGAGSAGDAFTFADHGVIKLKGFATGAMRSSSVGSFGDIVTITSPEVANGTSGSFQVSIAVDGLLATSGGFVTWIAKVEYSTSSALLSPAIHVDGLQTATGYVGDSFGLHVGTVPFVYGRPLLVAASLTGTAETFVSGFEAGYDLSRSFYWNGITSVTAGGLPVASYSIVADSGTDYLQSFVPAPVPEPANAVLLVPGIALIWAQRRLARRIRSARATQPCACE
jgi:hypothetical protein